MLACPESFTCKRARNIKRKPIAEENNNLCAVNFELDWHENKIIPINAQPAPIFFRNATPTSMLLVASAAAILNAEDGAGANTACSSPKP